MCDSAAVVKLVHAEAESAALRVWLSERAETGWISSALVEVESFRALASQPSLTSFITYDKRLLDAATAAGLPTDSPA
jgi:predicted nucleic acid-binding protein